ncbi:unnamed protein product, partial [Tetraodon nigroviridis]
YTDFEEVVSSPVLSTSTSSGLGWSPLGVDDSGRKNASDFHPLDLRPWDITVYINLYKVHGRLPMHCSSEGPEGPSGFLERLCFEMKKGYKETMLQLLLSPIHIFVSDNCQRPTADGVLRDGHLSLSGLQMRVTQCSLLRASLLTATHWSMRGSLTCRLEGSLVESLFHRWA